jgi:hypothetical protein
VIVLYSQPSGKGRPSLRSSVVVLQMQHCAMAGPVVYNPSFFCLSGKPSQGVRLWLRALATCVFPPFT